MKSLVAYCPEAFVALMLRQAEIQARLKVTGGLISALQKQEFDISEIVVTDDLTAELQADYLDLEKLLVGIKVTGRLATEFQGYDLDADGLLEVVTDDGDEILLHFEFQSVNDKTIPERLLEYSFRAKKEHKKLVYSCDLLASRWNCTGATVVLELTQWQENSCLRVHLYQALGMDPRRFAGSQSASVVAVTSADKRWCKSYNSSKGV